MKNILKTILLVVAVCTMATSVPAITVDGNFTDWGFTDVTGFQLVDSQADATTGTLDSGFTNGVYWSEEDGHVGTYGYVEPGYGGQSFDHEGLYLTEDNENYYIGLMTGMAPGANYASWSSTPQYIGDIAIDTGNGFDTAINLAYIRGGYPEYGAFIVDGVTTWTDTTSYHPMYDPTPYEVLNYYSAHQIDFSYVQHGDSYFYEFGISKDLLDISNGLTAFVTMSCGNDWLQTENHPQPVPEPGTMLLLGTGLLGMVTKIRKRGKK